MNKKAQHPWRQMRTLNVDLALARKERRKLKKRKTWTKDYTDSREPL